ncbi:MAG: HEAT repeat domain-containing protein [Vicinamibacteria bacterium]
MARAREVADDQVQGINPGEEAVAKALHALGPRAVTAAIELLDDQEWRVRHFAGYILRDMPGLGPEHLRPLEGAMEAGDGWIAPAIASIGTPEATRALINELRRRPERDGQLFFALKRLGPAAHADLLQLFRCGSACKGAVLSVAGSVLAEAKAGVPEVVDSLLAIATEPTGPLVARRAALRTLGELGPAASPAAKALLAMTHQEPSALQADARDALLGIGGPGTKAALEAALDVKDPEAALIRLARLGRAGQEAGSRVEQILLSNDRDLRATAAQTLGLIGYEPATVSLVGALNDADDWRLAFQAAQALGRIGAPEARGALQAAAAQHWYPPVREAARTALRALDGAHRYEPPTNPGIFFEAILAGRRRPCAEKADYPPAPLGRQDLDPESQPVLAERLSYERERRRLVPTVGLRIDNGWLVGESRGEWGGELMFLPDAGSPSMLIDDNVGGIHNLPGGRIVVVAGLSHLGLSQGTIYEVTCSPGACSARAWKILPGAPSSSWLLDTGDLLINTTGGSVVLSANGALRMAACDAAQ